LKRQTKRKETVHDQLVACRNDFSVGYVNLESISFLKVKSNNKFSGLNGDIFLKFIARSKNKEKESTIRVDLYYFLGIK
jgi:hypothetical protein